MFLFSIKMMIDSAITLGAGVLQKRCSEKFLRKALGWLKETYIRVFFG